MTLPAEERQPARESTGRSRRVVITAAFAAVTAALVYPASQAQAPTPAPMIAATTAATSSIRWSWTA